MEKEAQEALNTAFSEMIETDAGRAELQEAGLTYIKKFLREESFARKVLPPVTVTKYDVQRSKETDTVEKIVDLEPDSTAVALNFRAEAAAQFVEARRYGIPFFTISSKLYEKTEQELYAYESPVIKIIQDNSPKDIQETEDSVFLNYCGLSVARTGKVLQLPAVARLNAKTMLTDLFTLVDQDRLQTDKVLMANTTFNDVIALPNEQLGSGMSSEVVKDGYSYNSLLGKKLIVSTKTNLIPYGVVWAFADQKYLGNFFILNNTKFYINKRAELIQWKAWEVVGLGIGNISSIAKLEFGAAVVTP